MKKNTIKKVLALSAILALAAAAAGCSEKKVQEPIEDPIEVTISIDFPDGAEAEDITEEAFLVEDGTTVLDALQIYCNVNDIPVNVETTAAAVYGIKLITATALLKIRTRKQKQMMRRLLQKQKLMKARRPHSPVPGIIP